MRTEYRKLDDAVDVFRASAYLNFRDTIDYSDIFVLMHMGWRNFTERKKLQQIIFDTFFQKKEDIEKDLILMREQLQKINNYGIANVEPFIHDKVKLDLEDNNDRMKYNKYVEFFISVLEALEVLKNDFESTQDKYYFAMNVEEMIENNIFIIDYKNSSFTDKYLSEYHELYVSFKETYESYFMYAGTKAKMLELI